MVRSRPYQKNDQCYVEQKNFQHARSVFEYVRIEHPELIEQMNEIYRDYWNPLQNFFIPTMKLASKKREGAKIINKYKKKRPSRESWNPVPQAKKRKRSFDKERKHSIL
jgi:hypothetical protein